MDILNQAAQQKNNLGIGDFLKNVQELDALGMAPSATTTCCATGTC